MKVSFCFPFFHRPLACSPVPCSHPTSSLSSPSSHRSRSLFLSAFFSPSNAVLAMLIYLRHLTRNQWKDRWKSHIAGMICLRSSCHAQRCLLHGKFHHCPLAACSARGMMLLDMTVSTLVAPDCLSSAPGMTE